MTAAEIAQLIGEGRYDLSTEKACQAGIETLLAASLPLGVSLSREHRLGPYDIPDFFIGGAIVVEVKMRRAGAGAILRQLARYADYRDVEAIVLASNKALAAPRQIGRKPLHFVSLGRAWL